MSLDNIQIPEIILQELYTNTLVDLKTGKPSGDSQKEAQLAFLGENQKRIAVLVNDPEAIYLSDGSLNFLLGILTACKLSMADIALVNITQNSSLNYMAITEILGAEKILLFGVSPSDIELPLQFPHYQVQRYNNQVYLFSPGLPSLEKDKAEKMKLWACLKQVFPIA
jgi:hypothetical protein